jgi:hypothetical protein
MLRMWEEVLNRFASQEATMASQDASIEELRRDHQALQYRHVALEREHYALARAAPKTSTSEPKIPEAPMFGGDRKELLPFLTKCLLKFEGQPSRFQNERAKVLYAGTHLEGPVFNWFQPLIRKWPADTPSDLVPEEIKNWEAF